MKNILNLAIINAICGTLNGMNPTSLTELTTSPKASSYRSKAGAEEQLASQDMKSQGNEILEKYFEENGIKDEWVCNTKLTHNFDISKGAIEPVIRVSNDKIIFGTTSGDIVIFDFITGKVQDFKAHNNDIVYIVIVDGKIISASHPDNVIKVWNLSTQELLHEFQGNNMFIRLISNNNIVVSYTNLIAIWNINTGQKVHVFNKSVDFNSITLSGNKLIFKEKGEVKILDLNSKKTSTLCNVVGLGTYRLLDDKIVVGTSWHENLSIWDLNSQKLLFKLNDADSKNTIITDDDLIITVFHNLPIRQQTPIITIYENRGLILRKLMKKDNPLAGIPIPDLQNIILDYFSWEPIRELKGHKTQICSLIVSGNRIISESIDKTVIVWDLKTGDRLFTLEDPSAPNDFIKLMEVAFNNSPMRILDENVISVAHDKTIRILDLATYKVHLIKQNGGEEFSLRGDKIISEAPSSEQNGCKEIKLWINKANLVRNKLAEEIAKKEKEKNSSNNSQAESKNSDEPAVARANPINK